MEDAITRTSTSANGCGPIALASNIFRTSSACQRHRRAKICAIEKPFASSESDFMPNNSTWKEKAMTGRRSE